MKLKKIVATDNKAVLLSKIKNKVNIFIINLRSCMKRKKYNVSQEEATNLHKPSELSDLLKDIPPN